MPEDPAAPVDRYAVFGNPIAHSKSPLIHSLFAQQTGQQLRYTAELAEPGSFDNSIRAFLKENGKGMNITVPFKEDAWRLADIHSERAEHAGAVNTLIKLADGKLKGDTTDGIGLVNDLVENKGVMLKDRDILIVGAGGAVRGVLEPILGHNPASLVIANRTAEKAVALADDFSGMGNIRGCGLDQVGDDAFDLVINGTAASLHGEVPPLPTTVFKPGASSYDMMYGAGDTAFMTWSKENGAEECFDGLGMLVEQAAESFYLWRGVRPETASVIVAVREELERT